MRGPRAHAPEWTDHNVSDPGITLLQVLVYALPVVAAGVAAGLFLVRRSDRRL
jgi:hypothetical protein